MRITRGSPVAGVEQQVSGVFALLPVGSEPQRKYRQTFTCTLPTGGVADGIRFLPETRLTLRLQMLEFDARAPGAFESASVTDRGNKVLLQLPAARTLHRVKIAGATGQLIRAFRTDGPVTAEEHFAQALHVSAGAELDILDPRVALGFSNEAELAASQIQLVILRSLPANPKVGLKVPLLGEDEFFLSGEDGPLLPDPLQSATLDAALLRVLTTLSGRIQNALAGGLLPASLPLQIIVESDTPALLQITAFNLDYRLLRRRFSTPALGTEPAKKQVLRFGGGTLQTQEIALEVPKAASFARAVMKLTSTFALAAAGEAEAEAGEVSEVAVAGEQALHLLAGGEVAARIALPGALLPEGGTAEVLVLSGQPLVSARLYADDSAAPGALLAQASFAAHRVGQRQTYRFRFPRSAVVSGQAWLALTLSEGAAAWLLAAGEQGAACARSAAGTWTRIDIGANRALAGLYGADGSVVAADADSSFNGVRLRIGATPLPPLIAQETQEHSLAAALSLLAQSAPGAVFSLSLEVLSSQQGQVTVFAPELEYDAAI